MDEALKPIDLEGVKTSPAGSRPSKVSMAALARVWKKGGAARRVGRPVILGMGAHVIEWGLSPVVIEGWEDPGSGE